MKVYPFSSNYSSMNLPLIREIAAKVRKLDLSTDEKSEKKNFVVLSKFKGSKVEPILQHFSYGFLLIAKYEDVTSVYENFIGVKFSTFEGKDDTDVYILTQSLDYWVERIISLSKPSSSDTILKLINQIQNELEKQGLGFLLSEYKKVPHDNNYVLE